MMIRTQRIDYTKVSDGMFEKIANDQALIDKMQLGNSSDLHIKPKGFTVYIQDQKIGYIYHLERNPVHQDVKKRQNHGYIYMGKLGCIYDTQIQNIKAKLVYRECTPDVAYNSYESLQQIANTLVGDDIKIKL